MKKILSILLFVAPIFVMAQNIGIGTNTPSEKLHVAGNIKADTVKPAAIKLLPNAGNGKILTSDAAGNASWQAATTTAATSNTGFGAWGDCSTNNIGDYQPVADTTASIGDLNYMGFSVSINGNYAIAGAPYQKVGANDNQGTAIIYQFNGTNWVYMQKIYDPAGLAGDFFGVSVAISGSYAIIGADGADAGANANQGAVYVYKLTGSTWTMLQKITDAAGGAGDLFGRSVSMWASNYFVAGAPVQKVGANPGQGSALVYQYNAISGTWVLIQKLTDAAGLANDVFGFGVSVTGTATNLYVIAGIPNRKVGANINQGAANIYQYNGTTWSFMQKITDAAGLANDNFGISVSISGTGTSPCAVAGIPSQKIGANIGQGAANVYQLSGATWTFMQKLTDAAGLANDALGGQNGVSVSGDIIMCGIPGKKIGANSLQGSALIFQRLGPFWKKYQLVSEPNGNADDIFGSSVSIDASVMRFLIGALRYAGSAGEAVFGKLNL